MKRKNNNINNNTGKLRNYSEVSSFNRLLDPDENSSQLIAGGGERLIANSDANIADGDK